MSSEWSVHFLTVTDRNKTVLIEKDVVERYVEEAKSTVSGVTNPFKDGTTTQREMVRKALVRRLLPVVLILVSERRTASKLGSEHLGRGSARNSAVHRVLLRVVRAALESDVAHEPSRVHGE